MNSDPDLSGAVLAGGASRRMGRPKHGIRLGGETLLQRQLRALREAGAEARWISLGCHQEMKTMDMASSPGPEIRFVRDAEPGLGPLSGLSAVMDAVETPWTLVLAVDLPAMTAGFLRQLLARKGDGMGVVPCISGRFEPLAALYPKALAPELRSRLQRRDLALQQMVRDGIASGHLTALEVLSRDQALFSN
ncbi:MAG: molybdenum cofactor guanylyltransferase, partial [Verrucomicrobiae bacterium]|nr:molybdenum cofactor guanylyltransferase [Verrucomicrobiae bacterium]